MFVSATPLVLSFQVHGKLLHWGKKKKSLSLLYNGIWVGKNVPQAKYCNYYFHELQGRESN